MMGVYWNILFLAVLLSASKLQLSDAQKTLVLTSEPTLSPEPFCRGQLVNFTCRGTEIPIVLNWIVNDSTISSYSFVPFQTYPLILTLLPSAPSFLTGHVVIIVTEAALNPTVANSIDISTTLMVSDISILNGSSLRCEDALLNQSDVTADVRVNNLGRSPPPSDYCFLSGNSELTLRWSSSFNSRYNVEKYHVTVTPDPSSCSSDRVPPNEDHICSGLELGTNYTITVRAINCGKQEGEINTAIILHDVPDAPRNVMATTENDSITVEWMNVASPTFSVNCNVDDTINYSVILEDNAKEVNSNNCSSQSCSVTFPSLGQECLVIVTASNTFGNSSTSTNVAAIGMLTMNNVALLATGVIMSVISAISIIIVCVFLLAKKFLMRFRILLLCGGVLVLVSMVLWVAVGLQVGLQDNVCDPDWQSARDGLIVLAHVFSDIAFLVLVVAAFIAALRLNSLDKRQSEEETAQVQLYDREIVETFRTTGTNLDAMEAIAEVREQWEQEDIKKQKEDNLKRAEQDRRKKEQQDRLDKEEQDCREKKQQDRLEKEEQDRRKKEQQDRRKKEQQDRRKKEQQDRRKKEEFEKKEQDRLKKARQLGNESHVYSVAGHNNLQEERPPVSAAGYSPLGEGTDKVYSTLDHKLGSVETTGPGGDIYNTLAKVPCNTMLKRGKFITHTLKKYITPELMAAWLPEGRKWPKKYLCGKKPLKVFFMNECRENWQCRVPAVIMMFLEESWTDCFTVEDRLEDSQIRVIFEDSDFSNWAILGVPPEHLQKEKPTMSLNFRNMSIQEIKATVIHQFGHALGLGHALMRPDDWDDVKEYVDVQKMSMASHFEKREGIFAEQWTGRGLKSRGIKVNYDEKSVMQYSSSSSWIKNEAPSTVPEAIKMKLEKFKGHEQLLNTELSDGDKRTLKFNITAMTVKDLLFESPNGEVNITRDLSSSWESIGHLLGVKMETLEDFKVSSNTDAERLKKVWTMWINHTMELCHTKYPPSWRGLRVLLEEFARKDLAKNYFQFRYTHITY